jgi:hypothetical protein
VRGARPFSPFLLLAALLCGRATAAPLVSGAVTQGGAVAGGMVLHVTSLADAGPGTLRAALGERAPKVIVFDVGGVIHLASDLKVATDHTTIAGQTAPAPGITLTGGSLRLRASDLVVQHIAVRPGPASDARVNGNRDAITIGGGSHKLHDIRVENVSLSWSVDEGADIAGGTRGVTVRNSIIAEALSNAGHPKGRHSMGMLINKDDQSVAITGNLFAANMFRNPVIARGASAFVGYNLIVDPGENAIHVYSAGAPTPLKATIVGNVVQAGPDSDSNITAVMLPNDMAAKLPDAQIYVKANRAVPGEITNASGFRLAQTPPVAPPAGFTPPTDVAASVLVRAGARPARRDPVEARIVAAARQGTARIVDAPPDRLDRDTLITQPAAVPSSPFQPSAIPGLLRIEAWLCLAHLEAGGPSTPDCPLAAGSYRDSLNAKFSQGR